VRVIEPVIFFASDTFILSNFFIIYNRVFFKALEAWRLELEAWGRGRLLFLNLRLCRNRSAAVPVFQVIFLYMLNW
jgi:hypothetical protein